MLRRAELVLALLVGLAVAPGAAAAHEALSLEDEFVKGVFSPNFVPPAAGSYELPAVKRVAGFLLKDSTGRAVDTERVTAGKVAVVSFIYTACPERLGCPLASLALQDLQGRLRDEGLHRDVVLLSISFDPGRDSPAQLAKYARVYGADPAFWRFMTAPSTRVLEGVLESYGQDRAPVYDPRGRFTGRYSHVLKVFLLDRDGYIRNIYSAGFLVPDLVVNDIKTVLTDRARD
ncbi:MAG: SCO family protein [Candidatus Rokubacteria bacterium]|nr:SCO family protein [Candidatus Rokubacteria bacterium]